MEDKLTFMKKWAVWTAVLSAIAFVFVGIFSPIEAGMSLFGHILKVIFGWAWVTVILETFVYTIGQVAWHWKDDYRTKYGDKWFTEGIKEDFRYFKENVTWKKVLKTIGIYVLFFAVCLGIFAAIERLVP